MEILHESEECRVVVLSRNVSASHYQECVVRLATYSAEIISLRQYRESHQMELTASEMDQLVEAWRQWRDHCTRMAQRMMEEMQQRIERARARAEKLGGSLEERSSDEQNACRFYLLFPPESPLYYHNLQGVSLDWIEETLNDIE